MTEVKEVKQTSRISKLPPATDSIIRFLSCSLSYPKLLFEYFVAPGRTPILAESGFSYALPNTERYSQTKVAPAKAVISDWS